MPAPSLPDPARGSDACLVGTPAEVQQWLRRLRDERVALELGTPGGACYATTLWSVDPERAALRFRADADDPQVQDLLEDDDTIAVGRLDSVPLQFAAHDLVLVRGTRGSALGCAMPQALLRLQRRAGHRVRPLPRAAPTAQLRHPMIPDMVLALRVLDVGIGGCALFLPADVPPLAPGVRINGAWLDLDADTRFHTGLQLQHVTCVGHDSKGVRLGCEFVGTDGQALRALQRYIDQAQKLSRLMGGQ